MDKAALLNKYSLDALRDPERSKALINETLETVPLMGLAAKSSNIVKAPADPRAARFASESTKASDNAIAASNARLAELDKAIAQSQMRQKMAEVGNKLVSKADEKNIGILDGLAAQWLGRASR